MTTTAKESVQLAINLLSINYTHTKWYDCGIHNYLLCLTKCVQVITYGQSTSYH